MSRKVGRGVGDELELELLIDHPGGIGPLVARIGLVEEVNHVEGLQEANLLLVELGLEPRIHLPVEVTKSTMAVDVLGEVAESRVVHLLTELGVEVYEHQWRREVAGEVHRELSRLELQAGAFPQLDSAADFATVQDLIDIEFRLVQKIRHTGRPIGGVRYCQNLVLSRTLMQVTLRLAAVAGLLPGSTVQRLLVQPDQLFAAIADPVRSHEREV